MREGSREGEGGSARRLHSYNIATFHFRNLSPPITCHAGYLGRPFSSYQGSKVNIKHNNYEEH